MSRGLVRDLKIGGLALAVMALFAVLNLMATDIAALRRVELTALDMRQRLRGARAPGPETVIVMIDDRSLARLGRWPLPREHYVHLLRRLGGAGARVVAFDVLFAEPEPGDGDDALADAMQRAHRVVLPFIFRTGDAAQEPLPMAIARSAFGTVRSVDDHAASSQRTTGVVAPVAPLAEAAALGFSLVAFDVDGAARHEALALEHDFDHYPSLALRTVQRFRDVPWPAVHLLLGRGVALGDQFIPTDAWSRALVNYLGPRGRFPTFSLAQVLAGDVPDTAFRDRIVLIGANIAGINDSFDTPFSAVMPGVERLATVVDNLLHDGFLRRPAMLPVVEAGVLLLVAALLGLAVSRLSAPAAALAGAAAMLGLVVGGHLALRSANLWVTAAVPLAAVPLVFAAALIYRHGLLDRDHRQAARNFARYLAPEMVERLMRSGHMPRAGGELRELTVLFSDIRGFSSLSERLSPEALTQVVNAFFTAMTDAILAHGGTIDKYIGDSVMAFWNAPVEVPGHAEQACRAALAMRERLDALNREPLFRDAALRLEVGIGINTGPCIVGNFGSRHRLDYSALGDAVNVAARLETEAKRFGLDILIGPRTAALVPGLGPLPIGHVRLRGRAAPVEVFTLRRYDAGAIA